VSWHQDGHYWNLSEPALVSAWIALRESTVENGCLRVLPGSHVSQLPHGSRRHPDNMLGTGSTVAVDFDEGQVIDIVLAPGEMSLHHVNMLHGSNANRSADNRTGYAIRYVAAHVRQGLGHSKVLLARGRDRFDNFQVQTDVPPADLDEAFERHIAYSEWLYAADFDRLRR
jgi:non-heme Fe2+,alpha-ketoglutarate-dependent halogenase